VAMVNAARILVNADKSGKRKTGKAKSNLNQESRKPGRLGSFFIVLLS